MGLGEAGERCLGMDDAVAANRCDKLLLPL